MRAVGDELNHTMGMWPKVRRPVFLSKASTLNEPDEGSKIHSSLATHHSAEDRGNGLPFSLRAT